MSKEQENVPKVFISYSWSSTEHQLWVLNLAEQLVESGVDVIFDKWDLKEGHDTFAFMEKMVNDESINKVIIVSDPTYAQKAIDRQGGVGTETLIISPNIYTEQDQEKFIVVLPSRDENGKPCVPTYYKGRMYIDLSNQDEYSKNFEMLLRNIYNKPLYVKPELGKSPSFLEEESAINLGTSVIFRRAIEAIKSGKSNISGTINEYLTIFAESLERFTITDWDELTYDDQIVENIELFTPARDEFIQLITTIAQYAPTQDNIRLLHKFLESLLPYLSGHKVQQKNYYEYSCDNFKFIIHELYLYIIAVLIKYEHFELSNYLFTTSYYCSPNIVDGIYETTFEFSEFRPYIDSLEEHRNKRLSLKRVSVHADMIKQRATNVSIKFDDLMQADFVLYLRGCQIKDYGVMWWPISLIYSINYHYPFEIFARAKSRAYFNRMKYLFGIENVEEFKNIISNQNTDVKFDGYKRIPLNILSGVNNLCSTA